ncbi:MAG TPA: metallophosphoesterase [Thermoanaerobaculaceae bacterium]|nr:metallophosphoesterase [Thermoanaerobaculaceae bacterium]
MGDTIIRHHRHDGIDRRGFLKCMAWVGTGVVCVVDGGILSSRVLGAPARLPGVGSGHVGRGAGGGFSFAQISDSHIGFSKEANRDVVATLQLAVDKLNALPAQPDFVIHTGDLSHLSKPEEFDTLDQVLRGLKVRQVFFVPGEHDVIEDDGRLYRQRFARGTRGDGWFSFDHNGVHFVGLVNVLDLKAGGLGTLGHEQLEWLEGDLKPLRSSTPVVVFAHIPLWTVYPQWGWGTEDSAQALAYLKRFGSVTVLNGHIHQVLQKVEGHVSFHTACSTAFPQPAPGAATSPGQMKVPEGRLRSVLGVRDVTFVAGNRTLAVVDAALAQAGWPQAGASTHDPASLAG